MGKIKQGILGAISGKVGSVVGSSWKGIAVLKAMPLSVSNPKTAGQVSQRGKFSNAILLAQALLSLVIKPYWDRFASKKSGYNAFIQKNIALMAGKLPSPITSFVMSIGKMTSTAFSAVVDISSASVSISWVNDSGEGYKLPTDTIIGVYFNVTKSKYGVLAYDAVRSAGGDTIVTDLQGSQVGDQIYVFTAFRRADGSIVSDSTYAVATVQA